MNAEIEIADAMRSYGIAPPDCILFDGQIRRFGRKKSCWYVAHLHPVPVCIYGDWKQGLKAKYVHKGSSAQTPAESLRLRSALKVLENKRLEDREWKYQEAKISAQQLWNEAKPAMFHDYLKRKRVLPLGIRVDQHNNLLVPLTDGKEIHSIQIIQPNGTKRFLRGGKTKGMFYQIKPQTKPEKLLVCEGFATGATLYMDTKLPVIVSFSANNLVSVSKAIRRQHPKAEILICGDDDHATKGNPGKQAAINAAEACSGDWVLPDFTSLKITKEDADFNDLYRLRRQFLDGDEKCAS